MGGSRETQGVEVVDERRAAWPGLGMERAVTEGIPLRSKFCPVSFNYTVLYFSMILCFKFVSQNIHACSTKHDGFEFKCRPGTP